MLHIGVDVCSTPFTAVREALRGSLTVSASAQKGLLKQNSIPM